MFRGSRPCGGSLELFVDSTDAVARSAAKAPCARQGGIQAEIRRCIKAGRGKLESMEGRLDNTKTPDKLRLENVREGGVGLVFANRSYLLSQASQPFSGGE